MGSREDIILLKEEVKRLKEHTRSTMFSTSFLYLVIYICATVFYWYMYCEHAFSLTGAILNTILFILFSVNNIINTIINGKELREKEEEDKNE